MDRAIFFARLVKRRSGRGFAEVAESETPDRSVFRRLNTFGFYLAISLCIAVIVALAIDVERRLDALARANSDRVQWSLAQLEVETQLLRESLGDPAADLAQVRRRFDIF